MAKKEKTKILIHVRGGCVTTVMSSDPDVDVELFDVDDKLEGEEPADEEEVVDTLGNTMCPECGEGFSETYKEGESVQRCNCGYQWAIKEVLKAEVDLDALWAEKIKGMTEVW